MNKKINILRIALLFLSGALMVTSCKKDENPVYDYFVSKDLKLSYTAATITSFLDIADNTYPEIADLKPFVKNDINVYKMIYTTTIDGEEVQVSGLVCTPAASGEYPVLSFQNGTNTVNAYAPSEFVTDPASQIIQFISSMGFIVLIADYPGFGKSANIPHPYLVKEPTVNSLVDMIRAVNEGEGSEFEGIMIKNEYYLLGYSQGGWSTLALHKALELDYSSDFNLAGSVCGAGPYNMYNIFLGMINTSEYHMPSYLGYIINAYSAYHQFTNPVSDILNEPYATRLATLYTGTLTLGQINSQLTTSITGLFKQDFLSGFAGAAKYSTVRDALRNNSITAWNSAVPLYFIHSDGDTHVPVSSTLTMYDDMIAAGTSSSTCKILIIPFLDHGDAVVPCMIEGLKFLISLRDQK
jgi:pimeloyl-ACP methyl ester carboxylesterase